MGYLFQGQRYKWQEKRRGEPALDLAPAQFVTFLDNHDQIANSGKGERIHCLSSTGRYKALTALILLAPGTPMLFQGQEFASSAPFFFFADHHAELAVLVHQGRKTFLAQFPSLALPEMQATVLDPAARGTFEQCKLDFSEREKNATIYHLHRDLLRLRREDAAFRLQLPRGIDGAILGNDAFVVRYFVDGQNDRLLFINLGRDLRLDPAPEPLLAPPADMRWEMLWSSDALKYGGHGTPALDTEDNWLISGECAVVMQGVLEANSELGIEKSTISAFNV